MPLVCSGSLTSALFKSGYINKYWTVEGPTSTVKQSLMQTGTGISIAASGLEMGATLKVIAGVGVAGFAAGPYFSLVSSVSMFKGSDLGMIACKETTFVIKLNGGVARSQALTIVEKTSTLPGCHAGDKA